MSRVLTLGNGNILVNLDQFAQVRDLYFPYVGLENHVGGNLAHRVGVFVDGHLSWTSDGTWQIKVASESESLAGRIEAVNPQLQVKLQFTDLVYNEKNIFVRRVTVHNLAGHGREVKVFFGQQFEPYQSESAHTAYYDPEHQTMIHYRNRRAFLIGGQLEGRPFEEWSAGLFGSDGKEGTHRDADDGVLAKNPIEHGRADSVIGFRAHYGAGSSRVIYYWLTITFSIKQALELHHYLLDKGPGHLIETTNNYWQTWVNRWAFEFHGLPETAVELFKKSLLIIRAHVDSHGGIIASSDSDLWHQGKDTYSYIWPRDAAYAALALDRAGDANVAQIFFTFCHAVISERGYFMHKYSPDQSLGSSWHPWLKDGERQLPIQEDETALVLWALWRHYQVAKDLEFVEQIYNDLIRRAADFLVLYRDETTGLPRPSYDLWEEKFGTSTFTSAAVYGALQAAANFAKLLGKVKSEAIYRKTAEDIKAGILLYLYSEREGIFYKLLNHRGEQIITDGTIDLSSVYGIYNFGVLPPTDERVRRAVARTEKELRASTAVGGLARYQGDRYHQVGNHYPGNPWLITTLWLAQYYLEIAQNESELVVVKNLLDWCAAHALPSGVLPEQLHPETGAPLSVAPLIWSHAEYVLTVIKYLKKLEERGICRSCDPVS